MRSPMDHGYGMFIGGRFQVNAALDGGGSKRPPKGGGKRPPGNGDLGKPIGPLAGNGISGPLPHSGARVRA